MLLLLSFFALVYARLRSQLFYDNNKWQHHKLTSDIHLLYVGDEMFLVDITLRRIHTSVSYSRYWWVLSWSVVTISYWSYITILQNYIQFMCHFTTGPLLLLVWRLRLMNVNPGFDQHVKSFLRAAMRWRNETEVDLISNSETRALLTSVITIVNDTSYTMP